jgi:DNA-directed RNA polymerase subunit RPC12/RpoP
MEQRVFHGDLDPEDLSQALVGEFDRAGYQVQTLGEPDHLVVQIASPTIRTSGGQTSITVHLLEVEDGVMARVGQQAWMGVAASLGVTALAALRNPFSLIGRLDDLAQDITSLQLTERIWDSLERTAEAFGASHEISEALRRITCPYCGSANPVGGPSCVACGAPLGEMQPRACPNCGHVLKAGEQRCPECGEPVPA